MEKQPDRGMVDVFTRLEKAGFQLDAMPPAQRKVLAELSSDELEVLVRARQKVKITPDVVAADNIGVFYY